MARQANGGPERAWVQRHGACVCGPAGVRRADSGQVAAGHVPPRWYADGGPVVQDSRWVPIPAAWALEALVSRLVGYHFRLARHPLQSPPNCGHAPRQPSPAQPSTRCHFPILEDLQRELAALPAILRTYSANAVPQHRASHHRGNYLTKQPWQTTTGNHAPSQSLVRFQVYAVPTLTVRSLSLIVSNMRTS